MIALAAGVKLAHVPYKGGAPALNDLAGGHVDIYVSSIPQALQLVRSGQIKPLAVTSSRRTALLPDVPTLTECGTPGADAETWWGIVGPAGMPADVVQALNAEINKILTSPELVTFLTNEGAEAEPMAPQQFGDMIRAGDRALDQGRARGQYFDRLASSRHDSLPRPRPVWDIRDRVEPAAMQAMSAMPPKAQAISHPATRL